MSVTDDGGGTGVPATTTGAINLHIHPNDDDPVLAADVTQTLSSGSTLTITPAMLQVTDTDTPAANLTYSLTAVPNPADGYFKLNGQTLVAGATFTQADIAAGHLVYVTRSNTPRTDSLSFTVKDGNFRIYPDVRDGGIYDTNAQSSPLTVNTFNVIIPNTVTPDPNSVPGDVPVNAAPAAGGSNSASLLESQTVTLDNTMLAATDSDNTPAQLVYRLTSLPTSGAVRLNGASLAVGQSFTQDDVNNGLVTFAHAGGEDFVDSFTYTVSDGSGGVTSPQTFSISVTPQNDTPVATTTGQLISEGASLTLTTSHIALSDADNSASDNESGYAANQSLSFLITGTVAHGTLKLNGVDVVPGTTIVSSTDLAAGKLVYTHDSSENYSDSFKLKPLDSAGVGHLGDGSAGGTAVTSTNHDSLGAEVTMPITIAPQNDAPAYFSKSELVSGQAGAIQEGATVTIGGATSYATINGVPGSGTPTPAAGAHLSFGDTDNSSVQRQYRITAAPANGQLLLNGSPVGVGSAFTQADLDSGAISYKHNGSETSTDSFSYVVSDGDWTVNDTTTFAQGTPPISSTYHIEITPRNDVPTLAAPASLDAFAAGAGTTAITGVSVADLDLADGIQTGETDFIRVEVQVLDNANALVAAAQLNYGAADPGGGSAFFSGKGTDSLIVQGTKAQVDAVLASLTVAFTSDADASDYKIRVIADDRLYTSAGALDPSGAANGGPGPDNADGTPINAANNRITKDIVLRASNFNDPPTISNASAYTVNEDAQVTLSGFTVGDVDSFGNDVTATVRLYSDAGHTTLANASTEGHLILGATTGLTSFSGDGTNTITITGSLANVQAALNALKFAGAANYNGTGVGNGSLYLETTLADFAHADGQKTATVDNTITIVPVNDQPTLSVPSNQTMASGTSITLPASFAVGDAVDISQGAADYVEVTVAATESGNPYGQVSVTPSGSATVTGNGTATIVVKGATADVQATLNAMSYTPADPNVDATVLITTTVDDRSAGVGNGAEGVGVDGNNTNVKTFTINVSNVNEAPVLTAPATLTVNEDSTNNAVSGVSFTDSDDFGAQEKITLDLGASPKGTITLGTTTGLTFSIGDGTADTKMVFTGTKAALNAALASLKFTPTANINTVGGGNEQPLAITVDDQGNTGAGGAKTATQTVLITITPVNDAPTRTAITTTLASVPEDTAAPAGDTVSNLFTSRFSDATDQVSGGSTANTLAGVAVTGNDATAAQGVWQYSTDGGASWTNLPIVHDASALVIAASDKLRFLPNANWNGTSGGLTTRLIDDSAGAVTTGAVVNVTTTSGGTTQYSSSDNQVFLYTGVNPVNDAPVASGTATLAATLEDTANPPGAAVSSLITGANYSDATDQVLYGSNATPLGGIAIVGNAANAATEGAWQYSTNSGGIWTAVPASVSDSSALILPTTAQLRFVPVANYNGTPGGLSARLADSTQTFSASSDISGQLGGINTWSAAAIPIATMVNPVNDAPVISGAGSTQGYVENAAGTVLEPAISLADVDDTQVTHATISITGGFVAGDRLNFVNQLGISGSYNAVTHVLTLTGTATRANYETALRSITFDSTSDNPGSGLRTISWQVTDANSEGAANGQQNSNVATTTVNVTPVNDAPGITGLDATSASTYTENGPAIQIDANAVLADPELDGGNNWNGATLSVARQGGANPEDVFSGTGALTLSGGNVVLSGVTVGSYTQTGGTLAITFNASATAARVDGVMQGLAYANSSDNPPTSVTLAYTLNDQNSNTTGGGIAGSGQNQGNGGALTASGSIVVNITPINDAPVNTVPGAQSTSEDNNLAITGLAVADVDSTSLTTTLSLPAGAGALTVTGGSGATITGDGTGTVTIQGTAAQINAALASVTYAPTADYNSGAGTINLTVATTDGALTDTDTVAIAVTPVADTVADSVTTQEDTPISFNAITGTNGASADNFENPGRAVTAVTQGAHGTVGFAADGTLTYTPDANWNGTDTFTYTVTSGGVTETATVTVNVTPVNDAPVGVADSATTPINTAATGNVLANDTDVDTPHASLTVTQFTVAGDPTVYTAGQTATIAGVGTLQINADGSYTFTPAVNYSGPVPVATYTVSDGALTSTATLTVTLGANTPPNGADATYTLAEDIPRSFAAGDFGFTDPDAGQSLQAVRIDTLPGAGTLTLNGNPVTAGQVIPVAQLGNLVFTPAADANGSPYASFTFSVEDSAGAFDSAPNTLTFNVTPVNDAPVGVNDSATTPINTAATGNVLSNDTDVDTPHASLTVTQFTVAGDPTVYTAGQTATIAGVGTLQINADGSYTFTPAVNYSGTAPVATYTVSDGALTDTATLTLTVSPNTPPNALNDTASVVEDTPASGNVLANDSDAENDPLSVTGFSIDTNNDGTPENFTAGQTATIAGVGTLQINANGSYTFTPATNYNGPVPVATYTVSDGHGGTASATLTLGPVTPVADLTAGDDSAVTNEDTPLSGSVAGNDSTTSGGALTYSQASSPAHGTLVFHADGSYTYTPAANYNGPDSFAYTVFDAASGESLTRTVHLTVNPVQDLFANDDSATTDEDTPLSGSVAGNDSTTSGGALTYSQASSPAHGTLVFHADGSYTYTPTADYNGPDSFTYTVFDAAAGESLTRTVHITVNPVADIVSDDARTDENKPVTIPVLSNDTFEGSPVVTSVTQGSHGSVTVNADDTVTYAPDPGWSGQDGFTYTVTSGGVTETASVKVTVIANPIPVGESRLSHSGLLTQPILPVQVDPALHVLFSVNDVHNEMSLHSGLGIFQADSVTTAELLGAPDMGLTFAAGTPDGPGGLSGYDYSPLSDDNWRALYPSNALYVQHAVRHQPLATDHALHVQNAVRASQLESAARNARVDAYNSATPGMATLFDPFALGAPLAGAGRTTGAVGGEKTAPVRLDTSEASQSALDGKVADARDARLQDQSARAQAAPPQSYAAAGFGSQLQRAAADFRPRMARQAVARVAIR
jgi:CshA-type fibril repeat protein